MLLKHISTVFFSFFKSFILPYIGKSSVPTYCKNQEAIVNEWHPLSKQLLFDLLKDIPWAPACFRLTIMPTLFSIHCQIWSWAVISRSLARVGLLSTSSRDRNASASIGRWVLASASKDWVNWLALDYSSASLSSISTFALCIFRRSASAASLWDFVLNCKCATRFSNSLCQCRSCAARKSSCSAWESNQASQTISSTFLTGIRGRRWTAQCRINIARLNRAASDWPWLKALTLIRINALLEDLPFLQFFSESIELTTCLWRRWSLWSSRTGWKEEWSHHFNTHWKTRSIAEIPRASTPAAPQVLHHHGSKREGADWKAESWALC